MNQILKVNYKVINTMFMMKKFLKKVDSTGTPITFDLETRSIYPEETRTIAKTAIKEEVDISIQRQNTLALVANSSGLSHPSIITVTHVIIGIDVDTSYVLIMNPKLEKLVFNWLVKTDVKVIIHNASFDLKIVHHRTGKFPKDFEDSQQLAKSLINDCNNYHSRTGLKLLVGKFYPPRWSVKEETDYEVRDLKDKHFLEYCAIDGSSVHVLWNMLQESVSEEKIKD